MVRARSGKTVRQRRKRLFKQTRGYRASRGNLFRQAVVTRLRALVFAYRDRRQRKRIFRRLWILRINAACRERGLRYSQLIAGLQRAKIDLDRKALSELAIDDPATFDQLVQVAREHLPSATAVGSASH
ncbi:MAG: 50S ribosomal protein L20 [Gemmataceae bacterium]